MKLQTIYSSHLSLSLTSPLSPLPLSPSPSLPSCCNSKVTDRTSSKMVPEQLKLLVRKLLVIIMRVARLLEIMVSAAFLYIRHFMTSSQY